MRDTRANFASDNFTSRRTTGHNLYDPESLLTGAEQAAGFTYGNSHREFESEQVRDDVCRGVIPAEVVPNIAPRVFNLKCYEGKGGIA